MLFRSGFLIAAPVTTLLVVLGRRAGALDSAGSSGHAKDLRPIPNIGGIAIAAATLGPLLLGLLALTFASDSLAGVPVVGAAIDAFGDRIAAERGAAAVAGMGVSRRVCGDVRAACPSRA